MSSERKVRQILQLLDEQDRSMSWLGKAVGATRQSVQQWLSDGARPRDPEVFDRMVEALLSSRTAARLRGSVVSMRSLAELDGPRIPVDYPSAQIPFAGQVPCDSEWGDPLAADEFMDVQLQFEHPKRFGATVVGDSCYPALLPGDTTIWHADFSPTYGLIVLAQRKGDHGCTVKQLEYDAERGRPRLHPVNPAHGEPEDGEGWGVIARLVAVLRQEDGLKKTWFLQTGLRPRHLAD